METRDGQKAHIGSDIALYYQASADGYLSLYHFGSAGTVQRLFPNKQQRNNFIQAGQTHRLPRHGWLRLKGPAGKEEFKLIFTLYPSNTPRTQTNGLSFRSDPLQVIPTHYPVLFASGDMSRFFALPDHLFTEVHIPYTLSASPTGETKP